MYSTGCEQDTLLYYKLPKQTQLPALLSAGILFKNFKYVCQFILVHGEWKKDKKKIFR
jgi:hypothetical protein